MLAAGVPHPFVPGCHILKHRTLPSSSQNAQVPPSGSSYCTRQSLPRRCPVSAPDQIAIQPVRASLSAGQKRNLSIHEYQSVKLLNDVRIRITGLSKPPAELSCSMASLPPKASPQRHLRRPTTSRRISVSCSQDAQPEKYSNMSSRHGQACDQSPSPRWWAWKGSL